MHTVPSGPEMRVDNHEQPHVLLNTDFCANTRVTSIDGVVRVVIRTDIRDWLQAVDLPPACHPFRGMWLSACTDLIGRKATGVQ
jgi:hypothetical protein